MPEEITTEVLELGTPPHQFAAVAQSVDVSPIQVPEDRIFAVAAKRSKDSQPLTVCDA